jgi:23S rRNA pseudouridine2605 synthase
LSPSDQHDQPDQPGQLRSDEPAQAVRLQKVLAGAGFGSRRVCDDLISEGRVTVDGTVAVLGQRVDPTQARVEVDGVPASVRSDLVHYLLNKPAGVVTTASDPQGRPTVVELVPSEPRVFPVGRLDVDTEGLLLLTNDGDLAHRLTHPSFGVEKEYLAEVEGTPTPGELRRLRQGVVLDDGTTAPASASLVPPKGPSGRSGRKTSGLRLVIHEGRKRQVRRMCEAVGHPVVRLVRVRIGPLADRGLAPGEWRALTVAEVRALETAITAPGGQGPERPVRAGGTGAPPRRGGRAGGVPARGEGTASRGQ